MLSKTSTRISKAGSGASFTKALLLSSLGLFSLSSAFADIIAKWNQYDIGSGEPQPEVWAHHPNAIVSHLTMHGSVIKATTSTPMSYGGWSTAFSETDYVGFTVTPKAGETLVLTELTFDYNIYMNPATATYTWAYRVDEGAGFGAWIFVASDELEAVNEVRRTWHFPTPVSTTGTVEFGFFAAVPADTSNRVSPGSLFVTGTAGTYVPPATAPGVIGKYTDSVSYKISVGEASAVTYNWDTDTLFSVGDEGPYIVELSKTGKTLSSMGLRQNKFPNNGPKGDPEGLAYLGKGTDGLGGFLIGAERKNLAIAVSYVSGGPSVDWVSRTPTIVFGAGNSNTGLEGVALDPADGSIWGVQEREPVTMYHATNVGTPQENVALVDLNDIRLKFAVDSFSDLYAMGHSAAFPGSDHMLVLARDNQLIIEITKTGQVVDVLDISGLKSWAIEGITIDNDGVVYLCDEGEIATGGSQLHVLTIPHKTRVAGTGGRQTIAGTAGDDEIEGNPASDVFTGGTGSDVFVFKSLRDGPDTITDFTPGQDFLDLTQLLVSVDYKVTAYGWRPFIDLVKFIDSAEGAVLQIRSGTSYRTLAIFRGRTVAEMNNEDNFRFRTAKLIQPQP